MPNLQGGESSQSDTLSRDLLMYIQLGQNCVGRVRTFRHGFKFDMLIVTYIQFGKNCVGRLCTLGLVRSVDIGVE